MVEDDLLVSSVVVPALESKGHRVTLFNTADAAHQALQAGGGEYDVLFSDIVVPGAMSGLDLA